MTPLSMLAIATVVGATLFLAAGYVFGHSGQWALAAETPTSGLGLGKTDVDALRADNQRLQQAASYGQALQHEVATLREAAGRAGVLHEENRELRSTAAQTMTLRSEVKALESTAQADDKAMRARLQELRAQTSQVSALRLQNEKLRAKAAGIEALRAELKTNRDRVCKLEGRPEDPRDTGRPLAAPPRVQHAATMTEFVEQLVVQRGNHAAVVADGQGLLIAGAGDPDVQLAVGAVGAQFMTVVSRVPGFLPMGTFASLEAHDAEHRVLRIRRVEVEDETLLLTTLREHAGAQPDPLVEALYRHIPELMGGGVRVLDQPDGNA